MDWTLFWTAFGAIGTTTATLITAIAVVIAVKQYRQPLTKRVKITLGTAFPIMPDCSVGETLYQITVANCGIRSLVLSNIYLQVEGKRIAFELQRYAAYLKMPMPKFPHTLNPEEAAVFYLPYSILSEGMKDVIRLHKINPQGKIKILVTDQAGGEFYFKTKLKIGQIANDHG